MLINTKYLGEVEIEASEILSFHQGLLGFQEYKEFVLLPLDADLPLALLQSTEEATIGFIVAIPFAFKQDYAFDLSDEDNGKVYEEYRRNYIRRQKEDGYHRSCYLIFKKSYL